MIKLKMRKIIVTRILEPFNNAIGGKDGRSFSYCHKIIVNTMD